MELTHFNSEGRARMVNVSGKGETSRTATASGAVVMKKETLEKILQGDMKKGDVLAVAQVAGIQGCKKTSDLIPMCHNIFITGCDLQFEPDRELPGIRILAEVTTTGRTGVEMEALSAVSAAVLTIYDMCKAVDRGMEIRQIRLEKKEGGASGLWLRETRDIPENRNHRDGKP